MSDLEPGPFAFDRPLERVPFPLRPSFAALVAHDLEALRDVEAGLFRAADALAHAGDGVDAGSVLADLSNVGWQVSDLPGILTTGALDGLDAAAALFDAELSDRAWALPPEVDPPFVADPVQPGDRFEIGGEATPPPYTPPPPPPAPPAPPPAEAPPEEPRSHGPIVIPPPDWRIPPPPELAPHLAPPPERFVLTWWIRDRWTGAGIAGARVHMDLFDGNTADRRTDDQGFAAIDLLAGVQQLSVSADGYHDYTAPYYLDHGDTLPIDLTPLEEQAQE